MKNRNGMSVTKIPVPCGDEMVFFSGFQDENTGKTEKKGKKTEKNTSGRFNSGKNALYYNGI